MESALRNWGEQIVAGLIELKKPHILLIAFPLTLLSWLVMLSTNLALMQTLGFVAPFSASLVVLVLVHLGQIPKLMPGNVGPFYFFSMLALAPYGLATGHATAFTVLLHAIVNIPPLIGAGLYLLFVKRQPRRASR
jgi:uncharacterized membrane protein YbhN (UPF0104 family)